MCTIRFSRTYSVAREVSAMNRREFLLSAAAVGAVANTRTIWAQPPQGAKQSTLVSYLPRAVAFGATVVSDCRVDRVLLDRKRATGVRATTIDGRNIGACS